MRALASRLFGRSGNSSLDQELPAEVLLALQTGNLGQVSDWLVSAARHGGSATLLGRLVAAAESAAVPSRGIDKLRVFWFYYSSQFKVAFEIANGFCKADGFEPDMFVIAVFSLYSLDLYEDAWKLLRSCPAETMAFSGRSDYFTVAALVCQSVNKMEFLKAYIDEARRLSPDDPVVALNAYAMYFELGEQESFEAVQRDFDQGRYSLEQAGFALAIIKLAQDDYKEGFRLLELRYGMAEAHRYLNKTLFDRQRWQGEDISGKTLLISAEQGLGDTIQLARYLPDLSQRTSAKIVMETQPETLTLLTQNFPGIEIIERRHDVRPALNFDIWTGMMSLPHLLGTESSNIPSRKGYLEVPPEAALYWKQRVAELSRPGKLKVGLAWSGRPSHRADRRRSIPFERMTDAVRAADADFFALQIQVPQIRPFNLVDVSEEMVTLADTAALIAEMDLVITVDTSVVHVAGALGKETLLMLPYRYEWRWGLSGKDSRWYDSVSVFRQQKHADWEPVFEEVFDTELNKRICERGA